MTNPHDAGIPVLTEIIPASEPGAAAESRPAKEPIPSASSAFAEPPVLTERWTAPATMQPESAIIETPASSLPEDDQWDRMEHDIRERVLQHVMQGIDGALEQRVRDGLADALQRAVENLADDIRQGLHQSIRDLVTQSVAYEIEAMKRTKS